MFFHNDVPRDDDRRAYTYDHPRSFCVGDARSDVLVQVDGERVGENVPDEHGERVPGDHGEYVPGEHDGQVLGEHGGHVPDGYGKLGEHFHGELDECAGHFHGEPGEHGGAHFCARVADLSLFVHSASDAVEIPLKCFRYDHLENTSSYGHLVFLA